ncbi:MAG: carboxypeptidase regulatory-like domain-containing protein, partial [Muribaculaceae bacterium]|nr:carboxypeptidase regulatory-like domain-containing protein [Muribaculaceae bacterium]
HTFQNMSMSDALKLVQRQTDKYKIIFIYDDLEDFKVTTSIKGKSVPDALRQMIGFYPISMTVNGDNEIYVECTHKTEHRLKGLVVDENNLPLPYANVTLLNPADSTMLGGGVTNESGYFAIPYEQDRVLARITYVGYKPAYRLCSRDNVGTIKMQPDQFTLNDVTVKGERPQYKMTTGGMTVNVAGTVLSDMGTGIDVLGQLPRVDVKGDGQVSVFGSGTPLIYINNRPIQSNTELSRLKSSDIKSIDVITSPGARYKKNVSSVIRIYTVKPQGDGFSVSTMTNVRNNHEWGGYEDINVKYRTHGLELFAEGYWRSTWMGEDNNLGNDLFLDDGTIHIDQTGDTKYRSKAHLEKLGFNYDIGENNSLGASYTLSGVNINDGTVIGEQQIWNNGVLEGRVMQDAITTRKRNPLHDVNLYYLGKVGRLSIDFNGTWYCGHEQNIDERIESSDELDDRNVLTQSRQRNQMTAGKLVLSHPLWKGTASIGTELTFTRTNGTYSNDDQSHLSSDTR